MEKSPRQEIQPPDIPGNLPSRLVQLSKYEDWRYGFVKERLRIFYLIALISNPIWIGLDYSHGSPFYSLVLLRALFNLAWIIGFWRIHYENSLLELKILLVTTVLIPNMGIAEMTVVLGGFSSQYYNGINLLFLAGAVIIPVFWKVHLVAHLCSLVYYFGTNFLQNPQITNWQIPFENFMFLVWTSLVLLTSVLLYERLQRAEFEARMQLLELDRLKSEFFANVSHELRTPLTLSLGAFKALKGLSLNSEIQELVQLGLRNSSRLLSLINELLDLAKFDSGRTSLKKRVFDLSDLVRGVGASFQSSRGRRIHFHGLSNPVPVEADPRQLKKVIYNLLSNAFKFSDPEEGQVWIKLNEQSKSLQLAFEDNGIGIPHEQLERIFNRFSQVEGASTRLFEGTGIGLALVREIIQLHGGTITVESKLGEGSIFTMTLPRGAASLENLGRLEEEEFFDFIEQNVDQQHSIVPIGKEGDQSNDSPLILVADDNSDMRGYLQRILAKHYRLCLAKDGQEAVKLAKEVHPDLILTDMMMPQMSGDELLKAVRNDPTLASTPVIFLTARAGTEARVECLEEGADDYIQKPFDDNEVLARIGNIIRTRSTERKLIELQKEKLSRFLPAHVAELILSGSAEDFLHGHRTEITVLFIDLRGFTAFAESAEPEDIMGLLGEFQAEMGKIITENQGTLERFTGDGMMVFFNDPLPVRNHQAEAAHCALSLHLRVKDLQESWKGRGFTLGVGIGMATGFATLGIIGFEERRDYTAIGSVTNLAARLCAEAQDEQILIPERFKNQVADLFDCEPIGEMKLKGFRNSIHVFNIVGRK
ncbi:MAG TPA: ATP-binding protein [Nitrospirales bacterium]|nr:ATP-binding protein [Nitrospirales bacterium]